jgi:glycosyltransferase involved in cell wall biosynthesis
MSSKAVPVLQVLGRSAGGIARHVADLATAIDPGSFDVTVAGPSGLPVPMPETMLPLEIPDGPFGHSRAVKRLRNCIEERGIAVVHAHGLRAGIDAGRAAAGKDVLVVVTIHNLIHPAILGRAKAVLYATAERLVMRRADLVLCVSRQIADHLAAKSPVSSPKLEVLYLGVDDPPAPERDRAAIRSALGLSGESLIVTASRLAPQKRLSVMLRAFRALPDAHLAVLGQGPDMSALRSQASTLGIEERIHWLGFRQDAIDFIRAADVFCLSSVWEGVPLAAQEAILTGTPIVATAVGGMPELVEDGRSGRLVPPDDADALRAALDQVLTDPDIARSFSREAALTFRERFSRERMLRRLEEIYGRRTR